MKLETFSQYLMRKNETIIVSFFEIFKGKNGVFLCIDQDDRQPIKIETHLTEEKAKQLINEIPSILSPLIKNATFYFEGWKTNVYFETEKKTVSIYFENI